ncbi:MAG: hypothetical protein Q8Q33_08910 [Chlamydiota bacterium]|nr:hypothetical protein [Chlamydiota bacterium]
MKKMFLLLCIALYQISCVYESPTWSKNGEKILFGALFHDDMDEEQYQFFLWNSKDKSIRQITQYNENHFGMSGSLAPDGKTFISFEKRNEQDETDDEETLTLCRRDIEHGTSSDMMDLAKSENHLPVYQPYSTKGDRFAINTYNKKTMMWQICILGADGQKRFLNTSQSAILPVWSPDDAWIAYLSIPVAQDGASLASTYQLVIESTNLEEKIVLANAIPFPDTSEKNILSFLAPSWSPDGSSIAFVYSNQIATINIQDRTQKIITDTPLLKIWPRYAPNATYIAYNVIKAPNKDSISYGNNTIDIWITDPQGQSHKQLTQLDGEAYLPAWSPSSDQIAFLYTNEVVSFLLSIVDIEGNVRFYPATASQKTQLAEYYIDQSKNFRETNPQLSKQNQSEAKQLLNDVIQKGPNSYWAKKANELISNSKS